MITRYSFGKMAIDGNVYRKDVMILPDGKIHHPWWRTAGHKLSIVDIQAILDASPKSLIVGTGNPGFMRPDAGFAEELESRGIDLTILPTKKAVQRFNEAIAQGERCAGCFHLTC